MFNGSVHSPHAGSSRPAPGYRGLVLGPLPPPKIRAEGPSQRLATRASRVGRAVAAPAGSARHWPASLAIDQAYRAHEAGQDLRGKTRVATYLPLKALAVDVRQNLERPLAEIAESGAGGLGLASYLASRSRCAQGTRTNSGARAA